MWHWPLQPFMAGIKVAWGKADLLSKTYWKDDHGVEKAVHVEVRGIFPRITSDWKMGSRGAESILAHSMFFISCFHYSKLDFQAQKRTKQ